MFWLWMDFNCFLLHSLVSTSTFIPQELAQAWYILYLHNLIYISVLFCSTRRDLQRTASSGSLSYPESPEFTMRPRTLSNASSCGGGGGRMSPMPCLPRGPLLPTATASPASTASATAASVASSDMSNASSTATLAEASAVLDRWVKPNGPNGLLS